MTTFDNNRPYADFLQILRRSTDRVTDDPIREELFSVERLEHYATYLAGELVINKNPKRRRYILPELKKNGDRLLEAYLRLTEALRTKEVVSPAANWFVDNFHIVEEQLREIKQDLPRNYYDELPKLSSGELEGYPRIYAIALAMIAHTDSRLDVETLKRFIRSFQINAPLTIGELWAIAITLRIALVENLTPLALRIVSARKKRLEADALADALLALTVQPEMTPDKMLATLQDRVGSPEQFDRAFIVQLIQRLRDQDLDVLPAFEWLERQLDEHYRTTTEQVTQLEHHRQATAQVTVGNIISSMRLLSSVNWEEFVESVSLVDPILSQDPVYPQMDFSTRDRYRHAIEKLSRGTRLGEREIAEKVVSFAKSDKSTDGQKEKDIRRNHIGYFLISEGLSEFERSVNYRSTLGERIERAALRHPTGLYLGLQILFTVLFLLPVLKYFSDSGGHLLTGLCFCLLALIPASEFALSILNHNVSFFLRPKALPKWDTTKGIPPNAVTMVVIPTLLTSEAVINELLEQLQIHYLANHDPQIYFALLGDYSDAAQERLAQDETLLKSAQRGIDHLNETYCALGSEGRAGEQRFFLFHRKRLFNPFEEKWMGYERKRGKLHEFNLLLRGETQTSYLPFNGDSALLAKVRFVITLDSDTQLPRGAAHHLIGTALHPLNQPWFDEQKGRVTRGFSILQPRVSVSLVSANRSRFARLFSGSTGLDPYTTACSDVYQDLFGEGSYTGKGLYVVDAFEKALSQRVPENTLLSHDLFEGCFARSALVSDIELFDDYPADYDTYSKRQHRWIRGDWQICRWLFPRVPTASEPARNVLSVLSRWKILDNLRRSLLPISVLLWLVLSWTFLPGSSLVWTLMIVVLFVFPVYATVTNNIFHARQGVSWRGHVSHSWAESLLQFQQILLMLTFIAEQSGNQIDAITRALYRQFISHRKRLEWISFSETQSHHKANSLHSRGFTLGPLISLTILTLVCLFRPSAVVVAAPFVGVWLVTPFIKAWIRQRPPKRNRDLEESERTSLRLYARRTWHFFETFVTSQDNYLAPDNFQEEPQPVVAHRTSPTNIGLQLLALSSAYDFGYVGLLEFVESVERIVRTLGKLEKRHGHYFNWYDTQTLEPLRPQYISTVDSGNLAGHMVALKQSLVELNVSSPTNPNAREGLKDTLLLLKDQVQRMEESSHSSGVVSLKHLKETIEKLLSFIQDSANNFQKNSSRFLKEACEQLLECADILNTLASESGEEQFRLARLWLEAATQQIKQFARDVALQSREDLVDRVETLEQQCEQIILEMDFKFLFDDERKIFVIGYNVSDGSKDNSYYDLLASESRLTSFIAIAKGEIPQEHWFRLGRQMTGMKEGRALISWTATMFEYLMPLLVMRRYGDTLLDETYESVVKRQIDYGREQQVPWGISEAGYNARDLQLQYQYGPFGIPGLGLKRGLGDDLVVSPYSTMLAAIVSPREALANLRELENRGALSEYGFYESIDYTPERLQKNQKSFILRSHMAHHQGMSLVSLNNLLNHFVMQERFHLDPRVRATELLLQERVPHSVSLSRPRAEEAHYQGGRFISDWNPRIYNEVDFPTPRTQLLSNGTYSVMITTTGAGYSRSGRYAVNRWREDVTRDHWGQFFFIKNRTTRRVWSTTFQPAAQQPRQYEATFAEDKVEFWRQDGKTVTHTEIIVSPEDNVEIRRISLTNNATERREFEVTSFFELVLAPHQDDAAHPAFSNLFIETEFLAAQATLLSTRRRRSDSDPSLWSFHGVVAEGEGVGSVQYETDRGRFLGRGRTISDAFVISENRPLSDTTGSVLDPIFSLRQTVGIGPGETARLSFATGVAHSREEALRLADKYHDMHMFAREMELGWTKSRVQLRHLNIESDSAHTFQRLAGRVIYSDSSLRPRSHVLAQNEKTQSGLWAYGISGDVPIVLARISDEKDMKMVRELLHGHEYLRLKGLSLDLVLLNERAPSYLQALQDELQRQIRMSGSQPLLDKPGGIFIRRADIMPKEDILLLKSVARVDLNSEKGTLEEQLKRRPIEDVLPPLLMSTRARQLYPETIPLVPELSFFNGLGGFSDGGRHYVIVLKEGQWTPAPWINVIANDRDFGFILSESGSGYTWSINSRENRLTPWFNDAVSDPPSEIIYLRDEETGEYWTPTPLPIREKGTYLIRHGQGYTQFEQGGHGIFSELQYFVPTNASVKIGYLRLKNETAQTRQLSVTHYVEWVLGVSRENSAAHVETSRDAETGILFAKNSYNNEFSKRVAFTHMSERASSFTCDRKAFLGRNRGPSRPAAMEREFLSGRMGVGLDPCAALQTKFELAPGEEIEVILLLGQADSVSEARDLAIRFSQMREVQSAFTQCLKFWEDTLETLTIKTPDVAMDTIVNRWLPYQTLSCRIWARSAFYQSGGAYGFRDQLQDVMAMVYAKPHIAREQILRAAARQFKEGDVQHWWHPPTGRGVRTHFSDDLLWLPYVTSFYIKTTGDEAVLDEVVPFIEAPLLEASQESEYLLPSVSTLSATLREHCLRTLDRSLEVGVHGLPLMGTGDWNDGMNRVGHQGKGESVWVGWFLYKTLEEFSPFIKERESSRFETYQNHLKLLKNNIEANAWDGDWYRRAYFDNGFPVGSAGNKECRIDSIAQSWAVLSGAGNPERSRRAMDAVDEYLIHRGEGLVKLFTPPFDKSAEDPGYIKGYVPGVRENGGQYTNAAIWAVMAFAHLGDGERAGELYALINPINHSSTRAGLHKYKVEPYVVAADIYGMWPHVGRGGWTWYTGSSSWMYRAAIESILGFELCGNKLRINPRIPKRWPGFEIHYKRGDSVYSIEVVNDLPQKNGGEGLPKRIMDGVELSVGNDIDLVDDGKLHRIRIVI